MRMNERLNVEDLLKWRDQVIDDIKKNKADLADAQKRLFASQERLELIDKLLELEGEKTEDLDGNVNDPKDLLDECEKILLEAGKPMHVNKIHEELLKRGVPIPGKGTQANVISRFQRSGGRFIRTGRGTYGLPEFSVPELKPVRKQRKPIKR
jgi:hypothetical protein